MRWRSALMWIVLGFVAGAFFFYLLQAGGLSGLPTSPAGGEEPRISLIEEAALAGRRLEARFPELRRTGGRRASRRGAPMRLELHERDLRDLALAALSGRPEGERVLGMLQEIRAEIDDGEIGLELVVNLDEIPRDQLSEKGRKAIDRLLKFLPAIGEEELPVGFYGSPQARDGKIRLGGRPRVELSILKLSLGTLSERLGIPEQELEDSLELEWPGFRVLEINPGAKSLEIVVRPA